ncbi:MAG: hypothetical protein JNK87_15270 [Bryobacterales bacterium]|nr:hypothetical protein [Bryobacterales bacterium]
MKKCRSRFREWLRATCLGWGLGLLLTVGASLVADTVGVGGSQTLLGLAMGTGVGLLQSKAMRGTLSEPRAWLAATVVGLAAPFLVFDVVRGVGLALPYSLYLCVVLGGLGAGGLQARLLRPVVANAWLWVPASVLGWGLAASTAAVADRLPRALAWHGLAGAGVYLGLVLGGGLILGALTGLPLARLPLPRSGQP